MHHSYSIRLWGNLELLFTPPMLQRSLLHHSHATTQYHSVQQETLWRQLRDKDLEPGGLEATQTLKKKKKNRHSNYSVGENSSHSCFSPVSTEAGILESWTKDQCVDLHFQPHKGWKDCEGMMVQSFLSCLDFPQWIRFGAPVVISRLSWSHRKYCRPCTLSTLHQV